MVGLLDIAPVTEKVSVRGTEIEVLGVSAKGIAHLLSRFPELRNLITGRGVSPEAIMEIGGDIVAAIIAAGTGYPADKRAEEIANSLSIDEQTDLMAAILRLTMPKGFGPFVEKLAGLGTLLGADAVSEMQAQKSPKPSKS